MYDKNLKKYEKYLKKEAEKFKLTDEDLENLYDLMFIVDIPKEINQDFKKTLKINNMDEWFYDLRNRLEKIVAPKKCNNTCK